MQNAHISAAADATYLLPITNRTDQFVALCEDGLARCNELGVRAAYMSMDGAGKYGYPHFSDMTALGQSAPLSRALAKAGKGQRVRYRDGDVTNLRLSNLYIERGGAKGPTPRLSAQLGGAI